DLSKPVCACTMSPPRSERDAHLCHQMRDALSHLSVGRSATTARCRPDQYVLRRSRSRVAVVSGYLSVPAPPPALDVFSATGQVGEGAGSGAASTKQPTKQQPRLIDGEGQPGL